MTRFNRQAFQAVSIRRLSRGFSLMELMSVLAIVGILSMVAYPSFMQNVRDSRRIDAHVALTRTSQNLERFFATNNTYTIDPTVVGITPLGGVPMSDDGDYVISIAPGGTGIGSSYIVTATAAADSTQADDAGCTVMTLDSRGQRTPDPVATDCW